MEAVRATHCTCRTSTLFSTLNYDRVFESAASYAGLQVYYGRHAPPLGQEVWLYKLHGSCTFMPLADLILGKPTERGEQTNDASVTVCQHLARRLRETGAGRTITPVEQRAPADHSPGGG